MTDAPDPIATPLDSGGNVTKLERAGKEIYLVGTAHVSRKSVEEVRQAIFDLHPDAVAVELDRARYETLMDESRLGRVDVVSILADDRAGLFLSSLLFAGFQKRLGDRLGVRPGAEMLAAVEAAESMGAKVVLADRNVQVTLMRCYRRLGVVDRVKILAVLMMLPFAAPDVDEAEVEQLKDRRAIGDVMATFAEQMPALKEPLIDERDRYLADSIKNAEGARIVGVVGAAHVPGVERHMDDDTDRAALDVIPAASARFRGLDFAFPFVAACLVAAIASGVVSPTNGLHLLARWVGPAALLGASFTSIAGGTVVTALASALLAPISLVLPGVPLRYALGTLEARLRPTTPADGVRAREDIVTPRKARTNRFLTPLLVAVFGAFGRTLGGVLGLSWAVVHALR